MVFMQCGLVVEENEAVAVVLPDIAYSLTYTMSEIKATLSGRYSKTCQKDFLRPGAAAPIIQRVIISGGALSSLQSFYLLTWWRS